MPLFDSRQYASFCSESFAMQRRSKLRAQVTCNNSPLKRHVSRRSVRAAGFSKNRPAAPRRRIELEDTA